MSRTHLDLLNDMRDSAAKARAFVVGMDFAGFAGDDKTVYAVVRALEIVGEAAKRIPDDIRSQAPSLPWRSMSGMRDKLVHDYVSVDVEIVWRTVAEDLPDLETKIAALIASITAPATVPE